MKAQIAIFLLLFACLCGCAKHDGKIAKGALKDSNVVVIVVDTLRADHLPLYGYSEDTAPFLTSLGKRAVVFEQAISACSFTGPASASFFTSLYPSQHGVVT